VVCLSESGGALLAGRFIFMNALGRNKAI